MKKIQHLFIFLLAITFTGQASAQGFLDRIKGALNSETANKAANQLTGNPFSKKFVVGKWTYEKPFIIIKGDNPLKNIGADILNATSEKILKEKLTKIGFVEGSMKLQLKTDSTFTCTVLDRDINGTFSLNNTELKLMVNKKPTATCQYSATALELQMTFNANKLLKLFKMMGRKVNDPTVQNLMTIANSYKDLQIGIQFKK